ncbi:sodium- and chloride-dependent glycine transporter 2-like isoform X2 [Dermacentor albipictus]|uniref:sodium- and chloride-dependent glycine transporter 2-like isoform X2 n=1 Tax=Dermacentor albipictus TaxID=60249 RepID=UPI0031FE08EB
MSSGSGGSGTGDEGAGLPPDKQYYSSSRSFLFVCICIGCSYQCVTEFPYLILSHGGACFLLSYAVVLILLGIPMAAFEMSMGQFRGRGCLEMWTCVPVAKGVGMAMLLKTFVLTAYKAFQDGCLFYYFLQALQDELPWAKCFTWWGASPLNCVDRNVNLTRNCHAEKMKLYDMSVQQPFPPDPNETFFTVCGHDVRVPTTMYLAHVSEPCHETRHHSEYSFLVFGALKLTSGIDDLGGIRWELLVCYIFAWFVIFVCTANGVATVGKLGLFGAVTANALFLPHAKTAIVELIYPRWKALLDIKTWSDATFSVLTGLAIGLGQLQTLASYNVFDTYSLQWAFLMLPLVMTLSNLLGCALVFGAGGYLARHLGCCFQDFETYPFVFPFVIFPEVVKSMSLPRLWSGIFFCALFLVSVDAMIFNVCTVIACAEDLFPHVRSNNNINKVAFFACIGMFVSGFPTVTQGGSYIVKLLEDHTIHAVISEFIPLIEIVFVMYLYGLRRFAFDVQFMLGRQPSYYMQTCWIIFCPLMMAMACVHRVATYTPPVFMKAHVPSQYKALAWVVGGSGLLQIPLGIFTCVVENFREPLRAFQPEYLWEPNTVNRVNAYFEELEEIGLVPEESDADELQGVLYDATEALDISIDRDEPLVFRPQL